MPIGHFNPWPFGRSEVRQFGRLNGFPLDCCANWPCGSLFAWPFSCFEFVARLKVRFATWSLC